MFVKMTEAVAQTVTERAGQSLVVHRLSRSDGMFAYVFVIELILYTLYILYIMYTYIYNAYLCFNSK